MRGRADRVRQVELGRRAVPREAAQAAERDLYVARAELDPIVQIAELPLVPDLDRPPVARAVLTDAHPFGVVAVGAVRRSAGGADPFAAALVPAALLGEALAQRLHQLLPPAERLDLRLLLLAEVELGEQIGRAHV